MEIVKAIIAEIERRMADNLQAAEKNVLPEYFSGAAKEDFDILAFIDSLPEDEQITYESNSGEKSTLKWQQYPSEDLEKEIEKYYYEHFAFLSNAHIPTLTILSDIAKHFYEQGKKAMKEQFMEIFDKWEEHAIRGMKTGAAAYYQGKIALITDLRYWFNGED